MSQDWTENCFQSDHQVQTNMQAIENNLLCLKTCFSGDTAPSSPSAGQWWYDTAADILKIRNEANSAWIEVYDFGNDRIAAGKVKTASLADGLLTADAAGRAKMVDGFIVTAKIADSQITASKIPDGEITGAKLANATVTGNKLQNVGAGTNVTLALSPTERSTTSTSYTKGKEIEIRRSGTVTVSFDLRCSAGTTFTVYGRVYKNGNPVGTERSVYSDPTWNTFTENISVAYGDLIQLYYRSSTGAYAAHIRNFAITGNDLQNANVNID